MVARPWADPRGQETPSLPNPIGSVSPSTDATAVCAALGLGGPPCQSSAVLGVERAEGAPPRGSENARSSLLDSESCCFCLPGCSGLLLWAFLLSATGDSMAEMTASRVQPRLLWELLSGFCTRRSCQRKVLRGGERKRKNKQKGLEMGT